MSSSCSFLVIFVCSDFHHRLRAWHMTLAIRRSSQNTPVVRKLVSCSTVCARSWRSPGLHHLWQEIKCFSMPFQHLPKLVFSLHKNELISTDPTYIANLQEVFSCSNATNFVVRRSSSDKMQLCSCLQMFSIMIRGLRWESWAKEWVIRIQTVTVKALRHRRIGIEEDNK